MAHDVPALLCNAGNNIEIDMIESLLRSYNIPVMKRWRYGGDVMMIYTGASSTGADLYVPSKLLEKAKAILSSEITPSEADSQEDNEFLEYAKQQETIKRHKVQKILVWLVVILLVVVLGTIVATQL
ncbi:MAG: DUF2007 domain-containing protein [Defluviitaleaceae bacterium]|nr:DUF2007 domain-containing protein [Defluviitaleaceae bacterium]